MAPSPRKTVFIIGVMSPRRMACGRASIFFLVISTVHISGMRSVHCVRAVFTALAGVDGIDRAEVSMGRAVLEHAGPVSYVAVDAAIAAVGFAVRAIDADRRRLPLHLADDGADGMAADATAERGDASDA
jgi:copper chaperone CopZ